MNEHFPGKEGGEGHARWKEHGLLEGCRAGRLVLGLTAWRAGLEGRVGNTRGVEGQRHREQASRGHTWVGTFTNTSAQLIARHKGPVPHQGLDSGPFPLCVLPGHHWGLAGRPVQPRTAWASVKKS